LSLAAGPVPRTVGLTSHRGKGCVGGVWPSSQTSLSGFLPIDTVRNVAGREPRAGIVASTLFLVGSSATIMADGPGTLFLGINEDFPGTTNNTGGFTMQVTGPK
jgi:hypothetical protein